MNRRHFLQQFSTLATGIAASGGALLTPRRLTAEGAPFTLAVLTNQPEIAVRGIEDLLRASHRTAAPIRFEQHRCAGWHMADLVYVQQNNLVDFRRNGDPFSQHLSALCSTLRLPQKLHNPHMLTFTTMPAGNEPGQASVFQDNVLVERLSLDDDQDHLDIDGDHGRLVLAIRDRTIRVIEASCKHKTCVKLGAARRAGQNLVCIPGRLRIALDGTPSGAIDSVLF